VSDSVTQTDRHKICRYGRWCSVDQWLNRVTERPSTSTRLPICHVC